MQPMAILKGNGTVRLQDTREQRPRDWSYSHCPLTARFHRTTHPIPDKRNRAQELGFLFLWSRHYVRIPNVRPLRPQAPRQAQEEPRRVHEQPQAAREDVGRTQAFIGKHQRHAGFGPAQVSADLSSQQQRRSDRGDPTSCLKR